MSEIISLSMSSKMLEDLEKVRKEYGFSGRSEAVRAGIRMLKSGRDELKSLKGEVEVALVVVHEGRTGVSEMVHRYQGLVKTQVHNHLEDHKCLELFVLRGPARSIEKLCTGLRNQGAAVSVTVV